ncbi:MAG TPA: hypothetical protein VHI93_04025 [Candidatus Thermoplasmatota archaeon]|nr:hypothetical protein [Candidatus Thermoplasmatota archaeon]
MTRKAHPADPRPTAERSKPRPSETRKRLPRPLRLPPPDPDKYPNLSANAALQRALHIHRALQQGMTRKEAERHADEHVGPRSRLAAPRQPRRKGATRTLAALPGAPSARSYAKAAPPKPRPRTREGG